jgi:hypothetical protein
MALCEGPHPRLELFHLLGNAKHLSEFLESLEPLGGDDDAEAWAEALRVVLDEARPGGKFVGLSWFANGNTHSASPALQGDRLAVLLPLIEEVARRGIYFTLVNIHLLGDPRCVRMAKLVEGVYRRVGEASCFSLVDAQYEWDGTEWTRPNNWSSPIAFWLPFSDRCEEL